MSNTKIEWATKVWNPVRGCSKVSDGCINCYAIKQAHRFSGQGMPFEGLTHKTDSDVNWTGKVTLVNDVLLEPLKWRKHERVFVNSMSDLFHDEVPDSYLDEVFGVMLACKVLDNRTDHSFMILTKRPERMKKYMEAGSLDLLKRWSKVWDGIIIMNDADVYFSEYVSGFDTDSIFPLPNVWLGTSVENQQVADERIPHLLTTPAAVRFLSCEPLLGPVNISGYLYDIGTWEPFGSPTCAASDGVLSVSIENGIDWVIVGGESGPKARPMNPDWARSLRDQCQAAGVPFFFKQVGEWSIGRRMQEIELPVYLEEARDGIITLTTIDPPSYAGNKKYVAVVKEQRAYEMVRIGKHKAGRLLDGREHNEFPEVTT